MAPDLPYRGDGRARPDLPLPPARMPLWRDGRPLKRWRYVGVYGPELLLCVGRVSIAGLPQTFWALWDRGARRLHERTTSLRGGVALPDGGVRVRAGGVEVDLRLVDAGDGVETVSPHGGSYIWTRKQPLRALGTVRVDGVQRRVDTLGLRDDSAGYHARRTEWEWSAGVGVTEDGRGACWNLVGGVHDIGEATERTVWLDGVPQQAGTAEFGAGLDTVGTRDGGLLRFATEAVRSRSDRVGPLLSSEYTQPFGVFSGTLPGGAQLRAGFGVMERHRARW